MGVLKKTYAFIKKLLSARIPHLQVGRTPTSTSISVFQPLHQELILLFGYITGECSGEIMTRKIKKKEEETGNKGERAQIEHRESKRERGRER